MGLKFERINCKRYKTTIFSNLNFDVKSQEILGIYFPNKISQHLFLKVLLGHKKPKKGTIHLNNINITTLLPKERQISYISSGLLRLGFLPTKLRLVYHILKTPKFLYEASLNSIETKYNYKNLVIIGNDFYKQEIIYRVNKILKEYFDHSFKIKNEWMETYLAEISIFHKKEIGKILNEGIESILAQSLYTYVYKKEQIRVREGMISFLQALWDKIYYISELDYLCGCSDVAKKLKIKDKIFRFAEAKLICERYLKILNVKIMYERYKLIRERKLLKKYRANVVILVNKDHKRKSTIKSIVTKNSSPNILTWTKITEDQWFNYNQKQEQLLITLLPDEAAIIKGKVLEILHKYHIVLLNKTILKKEVNNEKIIEEAKQKIVSVYNQAFEHVKTLMAELNVKMNWFKITKNLSSFDHIKIRLINAILRKKELIVFHNSFDSLTNHESQELYNIILNLKNYNPQLIFLILTKNIQNIKNYATQLLIFNTNDTYEFLSNERANLLPPSFYLFNTVYKGIENHFTVMFDFKKNALIGDNIEIKLNQNSSFKDGNKLNLVFNPNLISFEQTKDFNKNLNLVFKGYVKVVKKINQTIICSFELENHVIIKVIARAKEFNLRKLTTIYFEKGAILVYDIENEKLIANI